MLKQSFAPIIPQHARLLILGSLPGDLSLAQQAYYAHPQNRFWKLMFQLFDTEYSMLYPERLDLLKSNEIALWDVCHSAVRPGSMDTAIRDTIPNAIHKLLEENPTITHIFFNGKKAAELYRKHFEAKGHLHYITLPSTSPANAQFSMPKLMQQWAVLKSTLPTL